MTAKLKKDAFSLPQINRESLQNQAKDAILHAILNGLFMPGERVIETKIAEGLDLSRSTVRAAIQALVQEGLLVQIAHRGTVVMPLTAKGADELGTMREALESLAVKRAVEHATEEEIDELRLRYDQAIEAIDTNDIGLSYRLDLSLHQQLVKMAHHELLSFHFGLIKPKVLLYMTHAGGPYLTKDTFERQHVHILEGIAARDAKRAMQGVQIHFTEASGFLVNLFKNKEDGD